MASSHLSRWAIANIRLLLAAMYPCECMHARHQNAQQANCRPRPSVGNKQIRREKQAHNSGDNDQQRPQREQSPTVCVDLIPALIGLECTTDSYTPDAVHGNFAKG